MQMQGADFARLLIRATRCHRPKGADFRHRGSRRSHWARLNSFDFGPRLGDGQELCSVLLWPDFLVAQAIRQPLDEAPLPDGSVWHGHERVATDSLTPVGKPGCRYSTANSVSDMREIENRQPHRGMVFNDRQEKRAVATAHIHDPAEFLEGIIR